MAVAQRNEAPGELELVRRFVNTRDVEEGTDELEGPESLLGWFSGMGLLDDEAIADEEDLKRALALREGIRSLLLANNGEEVELANLRELNRVAGSVCLRVCFDEDGGLMLGPESSGVSAALGRILASVVRATDEGIWGRLKVCTNDACQWAFYDRSRNRSGKWCTMEVCGNRMKARAFRQRQGTGEGPATPHNASTARVPGTANADPEAAPAELRGAGQGKDRSVTPVLASAIMASEETEEEHE